MFHPHVLAELQARRSLIMHLMLVSVAETIHTTIAISPEQLEAFPGAHTIQITERWQIDAAIDAVLVSQPTATSEPSDVRWGLVFTDQAGQRLLTVAFGRFGRGYLNDAPVAFATGDLRTWMQRQHWP